MWPISGRLRPVTLSSTRPVPLTLLANAGPLCKVETEVVPGPTGVSLQALSASAVVRAMVMFRILYMLCFSFVPSDVNSDTRRCVSLAWRSTQQAVRIISRSASSVSGEFPTNMEPHYPRNRSSSQDLVDPVHCSVGASLTNTDCDDAIQECVRFRRCLESRHCSKVVTRGIDDLSTAERGDHVRRPVTQPLKGHIDQRMIVCLQGDAQIQLQDPVRAEQQPITSSRQNPPAKPRAFEITSRDRHEATDAVGYRTDPLRRSGDDFHRHEWSRGDALVFGRAHGYRISLIV